MERENTDRVNDNSMFTGIRNEFATDHATEGNRQPVMYSGYRLYIHFTMQLQYSQLTNA